MTNLHYITSHSRAVVPTLLCEMYRRFVAEHEHGNMVTEPFESQHRLLEEAHPRLRQWYSKST